MARSHYETKLLVPLHLQLQNVAVLLRKQQNVTELGKRVRKRLEWHTIVIISTLQKRSEAFVTEISHISPFFKYMLFMGFVLGHS